MVYTQIYVMFEKYSVLFFRLQCTLDEYGLYFRTHTVTHKNNVHGLNIDDLIG